MEKLIFVVDDNSTFLTATAAILEKDFNVLTMSSARTMFSLMEKVKPDLILLDVEMPEVTGFDALAKLKENPQWKHIPVFFITGWGDRGIIDDAMTMGVDEVLKKTVQPSELRGVIRKHLNAQPRQDSSQ